ncbi:MAG: preprotein translocase subunit YajC [Blastocatellia bacterium]|nr:preprotein translocase subunit YajC [Blastocatellia bacterium]
MVLDTFLFQQSGGASLFLQLVPIFIIFGIFYLLVIAPQRKLQEQTQQQKNDLRNNLKNGDKVVVLDGLLGTVVSVNAKENTVQLQIAPAVKIEVLRTAITGLQDENSEK